eukprot:1157336-Pelagomonas_calceolata.AAC.6
MAALQLKALLTLVIAYALLHSMQALYGCATTWCTPRKRTRKPCWPPQRMSLAATSCEAWSAVQFVQQHAMCCAVCVEGFGVRCAYKLSDDHGQQHSTCSVQSTPIMQHPQPSCLCSAQEEVCAGSIDWQRERQPKYQRDCARACVSVYSSVVGKG